MECRRFLRTYSRRDMLRASAGGFGQVMLAALAASRALAGSGEVSGSPGPPITQFPPRAKRRAGSEASEARSRGRGWGVHAIEHAESSRPPRVAPLRT